MIATIATVTLAASAAANPVMTQGRELYGYTQSLGEHCDMVSYCESGLKCTEAVFGTGKCVKGVSFGTEIADKVLGKGVTQSVESVGELASGLTSRKLIFLYTQSLGEPCDMASYCKSGLKCTNTLELFGTGKCVKKSWWQGMGWI